MNSRMALNLALLAVVVALALIAYFQPGVEQETKPPSLLTLDPDMVDHITITPARKQAIVLAKDGTQWRIKQPIDARANSFRIDSLLQLAHTPVRKQYDVAQTDLKKFRLDHPQGVIRFNDTDIAFGDVDPLNNYRYVMVADKVAMITDSYAHYLQFNLENYVDTRVLPPASHITAIEMPGFDVSMADDGHWTVSSQDTDVTSDDIQVLVDEWQQVQALRVSRYQDDKPQGEIRITLGKDTAPFKLQLLQQDPELILGRKDIGMRYHFSDEQAQHLLQLPQKPQQPASGDEAADAGA